jgi:myosin heavy subunit
VAEAGFVAKDIEQIMRTIAFVLKVGNLTFEDSGQNDACQITEDSREYLFAAASVLGVNAPDSEPN